MVEYMVKEELIYSIILALIVSNYYGSALFSEACCSLSSSLVTVLAAIFILLPLLALHSLSSVVALLTIVQHIHR